MSNTTIKELTVTSVPANRYGEVVTCLCGLGCDGMGNSTWAACNLDLVTGQVTVTGFGATEWSGEYEVCIDCGLVVEMTVDSDGNSFILASIYHATEWTDEAQDQVFWYGRPDSSGQVYIWMTILYTDSWDVLDNADAWESCNNATSPSRIKRY